ncbi:MAG: response regulator [Alphaproteobacteria bacterium]|nr:response regulator [Alphaproteobacteria bacterium]
MRAIIRNTLRNFGIDDIAEASDGQSALEELRKKSVDIVITDICMTPMDGIEFTRQLRQPKNGLNPYVPVLMVSGHTEISRVKDALDAGVTAFLAKPVTPENLRKKLIAILEAPPQLVQTRNYCGPDRRRSSVRTRKRRRVSDNAVVDV